MTTLYPVKCTAGVKFKFHLFHINKDKMSNNNYTNNFISGACIDILMINPPTPALKYTCLNVGLLVSRKVHVVLKGHLGSK